MTVPPEDRRFQSVLADRLSGALFITRPLGERAHELLAVYRENRRKMMQAWGDHLEALERGAMVIPFGRSVA